MLSDSPAPRFRRRQGCAVCYVSDRGFLFPSIASALSLKGKLTGPDADVFLFVIDIPPEDIAALNRLFEGHGLHILSMDKAWLGRYDPAKFSSFNAVPDATLGRFFIEENLPSGYDRILYIDGDTLIDGDLAPLLDFPLPDDAFAAVDDPLAFTIQSHGFLGDFARQYLARLQIDPTQGYFNAGVFLVDRAAWRLISRTAFDFFCKNSEICILHDQSALNVTVGGRRLRLSLCWNSMTLHRQWNTPVITKPVIFHFSGSPKPWTGAYWPTGRHFSTYARLRTLIPQSVAPSQRLGIVGLARASLRNLKAAITDNLVRSKDQKVRFGRLKAYEAVAVAKGLSPRSDDVRLSSMQENE